LVCNGLPIRIAAAADYLLVEDKLLAVATPTVLLWSRASAQSPQL
jgi:hypothetical protein